MNRAAILTALKAATNPEGELYRKAIQTHRSLPSQQADQMIAMDLAKPIIATLAEQPEYVRCPNMMIQHAGGSRLGFQPHRAAYLLALRAMKGEAEAAVAWLAKVLESGHASGLYIMPLWRLAVGNVINITDDIRLISFSEVPASFPKFCMERPFEQYFGYGLLPGPLGMLPPTAAITARKIVDPLFVPADEKIRPDADSLPNLMNDVRDCLGALSADPIIGPIRWFQFDDPELNAATGSSFVPTSPEISPRSVPPPTTLDHEVLRTIIPKFLSLTGDTRDRVRISLQRLCQAMLRSNPGDKAADLSIALEALLSDRRGENTWKVSTRAAVLTGWDVQSKLHRRNIISAAYEMRSSMVHQGSTGNTVRVSGQGKVDALIVVKEARDICASVIRAIIERGGIPSLPEFDVSGGVFGWP
jgi:hypothetical protein